MLPQTKTMDQEQPEEVRLQEQFVAQVEDHSLPAEEILTDQRDNRPDGDAPALYVP